MDKVIICWLACLQFSTLLQTTGARECHETDLKNGLHVQNCSQADLSELPTIPEHAEILDFSKNQFQQVPILPESRECFANAHCKVKGTNNHCRLKISFSRNDISSIHYDAFRNLTCLRSLDLSFNQIKSEIFHVALFQNGFYHLEYLNLRGNPLGTLPDNIIAQPFLPNLRDLDLSHCSLTDIGKDSIDDFGKLERLDLSFNKLETLHPDTFKGLSSLQFMDITQNQLSKFPEHIFGDLFNLKELRLADNKIQSFHRDSFYRDSNLLVLALENNNLTNIPYEAVNKLLWLQKLDLSGNPIEHVTPRSQTSLVKELVLKNMPKLQVLEEDALASFPALETLVISGTKALKEIHSKALSVNSSALRHVSLENNGLSTLAYDALPWKQLKTLKLTGNPWICDDRLEWIIQADAVSGPVLCSEPAKLRGLDIRALHSSQLVRFYSTAPMISIIFLLLSLPVMALFGYLVWQRRRFCPCAGSFLQGRYVSVFTRDMDQDGEDSVAIELKVNVNRLKSVSNGGADDTKPFVKMDGTPNTTLYEDDDDEEI